MKNQMKIKFCLGLDNNPPSFIFEGELTSLDDNIHKKGDIENSLELFKHLTTKTNYVVKKITIEK